MKRISAVSFAVLAFGVLAGVSGAVPAAVPQQDSSQQPPTQGTAAPAAPGSRMMGPGMMRYMMPQQQRDQMRRYGYGPGMMGYMTPEQWQQHWRPMQQYGHGPGMMGPGWGMMSGRSGTSSPAPKSQ